MRKVMLAALLLVVTAAFTTPRQNDSHMMMKGSPMMLGDAEVAASDTETGIAVVFTSKNGDVDDLRWRIEHMSGMYTAPAANGMMTMHGNLIPGTAVYEAVPGGARVTLTPKDSAQLDEYRAQVRVHVNMMKGGDHSGMPEMMKGMMGRMKNGKPDAGK
jgi:hypothetical protein